MGESRINYSSDAIKLRLEGEAFAFFAINVVLGGAPCEWDYVTLESPDGTIEMCACVCVRLFTTLHICMCISLHPPMRMLVRIER